MKLVIGLIGQKGCGKGTVVKLFRELVPDKKIAHLRFSDILFETFKLWNLEPTRENLQKLPVAMTQLYGEGVLTRAVKHRIETLDADIILLDGVRWQSDLEMLRSLPHNLLVQIFRDAEKRWEGTRQRGEKAGESETTFEQFLKEEQAETEAYIPKIAAQADHRIDNNGSLEELQEQVRQFAMLVKDAYVSQGKTEK